MNQEAYLKPPKVPFSAFFLSVISTGLMPGSVFNCLLLGIVVRKIFEWLLLLFKMIIC